jgi:hypothetical protein
VESLVLLESLVWQLGLQPLQTTTILLLRLQSAHNLVSIAKTAGILCGLFFCFSILW